MDARDAIMEAFCTCLMGKPLESISVAEICTAAGVSKKTYYNHFQSKQDIVSAVIDRDFFLPLRQMRKSLFPSQLQSNPVLLVGLTYETLYQKRDFYQTLIANIGKAAFMSTFSELSREMNVEIYQPDRELSEAETTELDYFCMFLATTSAQSMMWWLERDFDPSVEEVAKLYYRWSFALLQDPDNPYARMCASTARK
ncbi:MAG: TetR/AcrR family transcriptional regulator [Eggerthellaceae bacterium]|nr:TetR/AcrR family transcriptional regulator [Eggerthellaceae bacterium]